MKVGQDAHDSVSRIATGHLIQKLVDLQWGQEYLPHWEIKTYATLIAILRAFLATQIFFRTYQLWTSKLLVLFFQ